MRFSAKIGTWLAVLLALVVVAMALMFRAGSSYSPGPNIPSAPVKPALTPPVPPAGSPPSKP